MSERRHISITVNGVPREADVEPRLLLVDFLREHLDLVGTHIGCEHGVCGTCTVLMNGETIRSCITFAVQADGAKITTVEALAENGRLHPLQEAFWEKQGLQCGYCTPGMLLRAEELLRENPSPSPEQVREGISSNLCRCTGYQFIVESVLDAAERMRAGDTSVPGEKGSAAEAAEVPETVPGGEREA
jgi:carbon-monoxide dehydrogenase small subunit